MPKQDHVVYEKKAKNGDEILFRKLKEDKEVGVSVKENMYDFPFSRSAEAFMNRKEILCMILELIQYFGITQDELGF